MKKSLKNTKGFTLIELLIALSLLVVVCFTLFSLYEYGTRVFYKENDEIVVQTEIRNAMERIVTECRKASDYYKDTGKLGFSDLHTVSFKLENNSLYMVEVYGTTESQIYLAGDVKSFKFDISDDDIQIGIYSLINDSEGKQIYLESTYYIRKNYG